MVWVGRYVKKYKHQEHLVPGGKSLLLFLIALIVVEMLVDLSAQF